MLMLMDVQLNETDSFALIRSSNEWIQLGYKYDVIIAVEHQFRVHIAMAIYTKPYEPHIRLLWFYGNVLRALARPTLKSIDRSENGVIVRRERHLKRKELLKGYLSCFNVTKETTYVLNSLNLAIYAIQAYLNVLNGKVESGTYRAHFVCERVCVCDPDTQRH